MKLIKSQTIAYGLEIDDWFRMGGQLYRINATQHHADKTVTIEFRLLGNPVAPKQTMTLDFATPITFYNQR
jgi:hypothetical protein